MWAPALPSRTCLCVHTIPKQDLYLYVVLRTGSQRVKPTKSSHVVSVRKVMLESFDYIPVKLYVQWLSRGSLAKRAYPLRAEMVTFLFGKCRPKTIITATHVTMFLN